MPKLNQLSKVERADVCRSIARAAHDVLSKKEDANGCPEGGAFEARMFKKCAELGIIEDDEEDATRGEASRRVVLNDDEDEDDDEEEDDDASSDI